MLSLTPNFVTSNFDMGSHYQMPNLSFSPPPSAAEFQYDKLEYLYIRMVQNYPMIHFCPGTPSFWRNLTRLLITWFIFLYVKWSWRVATVVKPLRIGDCVSVINSNSLIYLRSIFLSSMSSNAYMIYLAIQLLRSQPCSEFEHYIGLFFLLDLLYVCFCMDFCIDIR